MGRTWKLSIAGRHLHMRLAGILLAAAIGLVVVMISASIFHISRREYPNLPINAVLLLLALFIVVGRLAWG